MPPHNVECHSIRLNARSKGSYDEQQKLASDGPTLLAQYAEHYKINVIVAGIMLTKILLERAFAAL